MDGKRAARIEALRGTAAWDELAAELADAEEKFWKRHIADIRDGKPVDQRELDYMRGKLDAIRVILNQPERAHRILERRTAEEAKTNEV